MKKIYVLKSLLTVILVSFAAMTFAETYSFTFTKENKLTAAGSVDLGGVNWTLATDTEYFGWDGNASAKGVQIGSGSNPAKSVNLSTEGIEGTITSVKVTTSGASGINATVAVKVGGTAFGEAAAITTTSTPYTFTGTSTGKIEIEWANSSAKAIYVKSIEVEYSLAEVKVLAPEASIAAGTYYEPFDVELTCATEGAKIYYTLDGTDPSATSTEYKAAINIDKTTTLKAVAIDADNNVSAVRTVEYTLPEVVDVDNIAAFITKADKEAVVRIKGTVTVTYSDGNRNHWVKDDSGVLMIFGEVKGLKNGSVISGIIGKYDKFNNTHEIIPAYVPAAVDGEAVQPTEMKLEEVAIAKINEYVNIKGVEVKEEVTFSKDVKNATLVAGDKEINAYNKFSALNDYTLKAGVKYDVIAIVGEYKDAPQLYLISVKESTGVGVKDTEINATVYSANGTIIVETEVENAQIEVFSITGQRLASLCATSNTTAIEGIATGVVIVRVNGESHKIIVK